MSDKYETFAQLAAAERAGTDYRVAAVARPGSPVIVIAPHGGTIELGTSEIARLIAGDDHSFFAFEGLAPRGRSRDLHITSHRFDHPECLAHVERAAVVLAVHGCKGESEIFVGGLDRDLSTLLTERLSTAGFRASAEGHRYPGVHALNICNRGARGRGAQLELTRDLREPAAGERIANVVRGALADYVRLLDSLRATRAPRLEAASSP